MEQAVFFFGFEFLLLVQLTEALRSLSAILFLSALSHFEKSAACFNFINAFARHLWVMCVLGYSKRMQPFLPSFLKGTPFVKAPHSVFLGFNTCVPTMTHIIRNNYGLSVVVVPWYT